MVQSEYVNMKSKGGLWNECSSNLLAGYIAC